MKQTRPKHQVVHVDEQTHAEAVIYCLTRGLFVRQWVSQLILDEVRRQRVAEAARSQ